MGKQTDYLNLPDFKIDKSQIPIIKIKYIRFKNFKIFDEYCFDFTEGNKCKPFICLLGPNGYGKTTILDSIQLVFSRYEGRDLEHLRALLGKSVRHIDGKYSGVYGDDDFLVTVGIQSSTGDYEIQINKSGFINDHPEEIKWIVYRLCFYAGFDRELHQFQLPRDKWGMFKKLFEGVTGFTIEEKTTLFDDSSDPIQSNLLKEYVLGFLVHKEDETINHNECSAGERKIIKCFSTLLSKEYTPSIILIDNIAMHVEEGRHITLIEKMKECFPNSQIFAAAHSYQISRNYKEKEQLYDLRLVKANDIIKKEPWRLFLMDEIKDGVNKLQSMYGEKREVLAYENFKGQHLCQCIEANKISKENAIEGVTTFINEINSLYLKNIVSYFEKEKGQ